MLSVENAWYGGPAMSGKKDYDATKKLPPEEPTQVTEKGLKLGLPTRGQVADALRKVAKAPKT
jgi:hypothetical protein